MGTKRTKHPFSVEQDLFLCKKVSTKEKHRRQTEQTKRETFSAVETTPSSKKGRKKQRTPSMQALETAPSSKQDRKKETKEDEHVETPPSSRKTETMNRTVMHDVRFNAIQMKFTLNSMQCQRDKDRQQVGDSHAKQNAYNIAM